MVRKLVLQAVVEGDGAGGVVGLVICGDPGGVADRVRRRSAAAAGVVPAARADLAGVVGLEGVAHRVGAGRLASASTRSTPGRHRRPARRSAAGPGRWRPRRVRRRPRRRTAELGEAEELLHLADDLGVVSRPRPGATVAGENTKMPSEVVWPARPVRPPVPGVWM